MAHAPERPAARQDGVRDDEVAAALVLRLGRSMMEAGLETLAAVEAMQDLGQAFGLEDLDVQPLGRTIILGWRRHGHGPAVVTTSGRATDQYDLGRIDRLEGLRTRIVAESLTVQQATAAFERIDGDSALWPAWVAILGGMVLAGSITVQTGGSVLAAAMAAVGLLVVQLVGALATRLRVPWAFVVGLQALVAASFGLATLGLGLTTLGAASAITATVLVLLLPVPEAVQAAQDAINNFEVAASARLSALFTHTLMVVAGAAVVVGVLSASQGASPTVTSRPLLSLPLTVLACAIGGLGNAVFMNGGPRLLLPALAGGGVAGLVARLLSTAGIPTWMCTCGAALALGLMAVTFSRGLHVSTQSVYFPGVAGALLPGLDVHDAITDVVLHVPGTTASLLHALVTVLVIGPGIILGVWVVDRCQPRQQATTPR